jgi:trk system potassium uptake protein TrkA
MFIIIVGGGKLGYYLAKTLAPEKHQLVLIEEDYNLCKKIVVELGDLGVQVIHGDGTDISFLKDARIQQADIVIAVTGFDENNLVVCQLAKHYFDVPRTIARVNNPKNINVFKQLGVDSVVSSTALIADIIELEVEWACLHSIHAHRVGDVRIKEYHIDRHAHAVGKKIMELHLPTGTIVISLIRDNQVIIPDGQTDIHAGDSIVALMHADNLDALPAYFL